MYQAREGSLHHLIRQLQGYRHSYHHRCPATKNKQKEKKKIIKMIANS